MALTGHLSDLSLSELIEFFCNQRKTGRLKVLYPQGPGCFYLQTGSVVDARIGVLRGIDAVYFALTLPNAKFEFSGSAEATERTINQPWTQVVLEGLRRLDEGIVPAEAFPETYTAELDDSESTNQTVVEIPADDSGNFLSFLQSNTVAKRKPYMIGAASVAVLAIVAVVGVPAGWYGRAKQAPVVSEQVSTAPISEPQPQTTETAAPAPVETADHNADAAALAARRQREKDRAKAREERTGQTAASNPTMQNTDTAKGGPKRVTVTVSYDESGRVTQASGADSTAVRIARQRRFPAGKAGSATITIPIN